MVHGRATFLLAWYDGLPGEPLQLMWAVTAGDMPGEGSNFCCFCVGLWGLYGLYC
jgi:hypothetical protein